MLLAAVIDLELLTPATLPGQLGERVRGAFLGALARHDPAMAEQAHASRAVQPYTVAWLGPRGETLAGTRAAMRWTALTAPLAETVRQRLLPALGATFDLSGVTWRVLGWQTEGAGAPGAPAAATLAAGSAGTAVDDTEGAGSPAAPAAIPGPDGTASAAREATPPGATPGAPAATAGSEAAAVVDASPVAPAAPGPSARWAGTSSYEALVRAWLLERRRPPPRLELAFATPATFHSAGRWVPLPLPRLVFGSLLDRWNELAPVRLGEEVLTYADQAVAIGRYQLRSEVLPLAGGLQIGFTGRCTYTLPSGSGLPPVDEYAWRALHLLGAFAFYAGVGTKTTMGMGMARPLTSPGAGQPRRDPVSSPAAAHHRGQPGRGTSSVAGSSSLIPGGSAPPRAAPSASLRPTAHRSSVRHRRLTKRGRTGRPRVL